MKTKISKISLFGILILMLLSLPSVAKKTEKKPEKKYPMAITMWDFSWLERRWPGAGYEDWDMALDELQERGYNCIRIDAYPHLIHAGAEKEWMLDPHWNNQDWGSPAVNVVQVQPNLNKFIKKCKDRNIYVALSTWWREDTARLAKNIKTPEDLAEVWLSALQSVEKAGLLDAIEFVDLSNEFPILAWTPFFEEKIELTSEEGKKWLSEPIQILKKHYPDLKYTYSFTGRVPDHLGKEELGEFDLLEPHIWMSQYTDFYKKTGYFFDGFTSENYTNLALNGAKVYYENPEKYREGVRTGIRRAEKWSEKLSLPLGITECWAIVDYKDYPLLEWDYVKELCELGTKEAAATGRWKYIATSNFCGPQFVGMWRDVEWHKRLTDIIKSAKIDSDLTGR